MSFGKRLLLVPLMLAMDRAFASSIQDLGEALGQDIDIISYHDSESSPEVLERRIRQFDDAPTIMLESFPYTLRDEWDYVKLDVSHEQSFVRAHNNARGFKYQDSKRKGKVHHTHNCVQRHK